MSAAELEIGQSERERIVGALGPSPVDIDRVDDKNQPYSLVAAQATKPSTLQGIYDLKKPEGEITLQNGTWLDGKADTGRFDQIEKHLWLGGNVRIFHDKGYQFTTDELQVDLNTNEAWGDKNVLIQGDFGTIHGVGFRFIDSGNTVIIKGPAKLSLVYREPQHLINPLYPKETFLRIKGYTFKRFSMRLCAWVLALCLLLGGFESANAKNAPARTPAPARTAQPIEITADQSLEWYQDKNLYVARGKAKASNGDLTVTADLLTAHKRDKSKGAKNTKQNAKPNDAGDIDKLTAEGNVLILKANARITGSHAVDDLDKHVSVVTGDNLRYENDMQVVTAKQSLEYWETTKIAVARGMRLPSKATAIFPAMF